MCFRCPSTFGGSEEYFEKGVRWKRASSFCFLIVRIVNLSVCRREVTCSKK